MLEYPILHIIPEISVSSIMSWSEKNSLKVKFSREVVPYFEESCYYRHFLRVR